MQKETKSVPGIISLCFFKNKTFWISFTGLVVMYALFYKIEWESMSQFNHSGDGSERVAWDVSWDAVSKNKFLLKTLQRIVLRNKFIIKAELCLSVKKVTHMICFICVYIYVCAKYIWKTHTGCCLWRASLRGKWIKTLHLIYGYCSSFTFWKWNVLPLWKRNLG